MFKIRNVKEACRSLDQQLKFYMVSHTCTADILFFKATKTCSVSVSASIPCMQEMWLPCLHGPCIGENTNFRFQRILGASLASTRSSYTTRVQCTSYYHIMLPWHEKIYMFIYQFACQYLMHGTTTCSS